MPNGLSCDPVDRGMTSFPFDVSAHEIPAQYVREYPGALLNSQEDELRLHVKQYTPSTRINSRFESVTIVGAHGNGFPKELYEPLWDELVKSLNQQNIDVRGIWIADVAHQGQSGLINQDRLGNDPNWNDHARDMLVLINHFRAEMSRPIVGIGHSMGAASMVNLSLMHPRLLTAIVLVDPVILNESQSQLLSETGEKSAPLALAGTSIARRETWPSRDEAAASFKKARFFASWDPRVLDRWIQYGICRFQEAPNLAGHTRENEDPAVTLTTGKDQENFTFLRPTFGRGPNLSDTSLYLPDLYFTSTSMPPFYRAESRMAFEKLPYLRPSTFYLLGEKSAISGANTRGERLRRTGTGMGGSGGPSAGKVKQFVLPNGGHLMPMEQVNRVAEVIGDYLATELQIWSREESQWKSWWSALDTRDKTKMTADWEKSLKEVSRVKGKL